MLAALFSGPLLQTRCPACLSQDKKNNNDEHVDAGEACAPLKPSQCLTNDGHHVGKHVSLGHFIQTSLEERKPLATQRYEKEMSTYESEYS